MEYFEFKWNDLARQEMLEKSEYWGKEYEYGYYDGFNKAIKQSEVNRMTELLKNIVIGYENAEGEMYIPNMISNYIDEAKIILKERKKQ